MNKVLTEWSGGAIAAMILTLPIGVSAQANPYADQLPPPPAAGIPGGSSFVTVPTVPSAAAYRVFINSDSMEALAIAKQAQPQAFFTTIGGRRVIQLGAFRTESAARQAAAQLSARGLPVNIQGAGGTIATVPAATGMANLGTPSSSPSGRPTQVVTSADKGYYVVIPVSPEKANEVRARIAQLRVPAQYVVLRQQPLGLHWAIGVYPTRQDAAKMEQYLRQGRLDSRVFFQN